VATYHTRRKKKLMAEINVVPYIDVMLVLLVIFMVTAPLLTEGVKVELPEADARTLDAGQSEPFVLTVDREGKLFVESAEKEPEQVTAFAAAVLRRSPKTQFVVRGDKDASYQYVVDAMVLLQKAGVESVGLVTDPGGT
jgi:biopolymer transport protein TolR